MKALDVAESTLLKGGCTFNPATNKNLVGKPFYAVSIYPKYERVISVSWFDSRAVFAYVEDNLGILTDNRHSLGAWLDPETNLVYLDVVVTLPSKEDAIRLGKQYSQLAIFDLLNEKEIRL
jgi:hypothetical protein